MRNTICDIQRCRQVARDVGAQVDRHAVPGHTGAGWLSALGALDADLQQPTAAIRTPNTLHALDAMRREHGTDRSVELLAIDTWNFFVRNVHAVQTENEKKRTL